MEVNKRVTRIEKNSILHTEIETTIDIVSSLSSESTEKVEYVFLNDPFFSQQLDDQVLDKTKIKKIEKVAFMCALKSKMNTIHKQKKMIHENFNEIKKLAFNYIKGFKKSAKKNRHKRDYEYSFSSLSNFLNELGVQTKDC
ncbi:hypothetical protein [Paenibacillus campi]|uniref:hypothetical protein n=1 Tax=Paenibacillus campi TaxID=3106031 RepID=UPI002AFEBA16|nr:hypothetical protein [Paenibacillus sp. SGZ-1014]